MVEPVDPFQGRQFEVVEAAPRSSLAHEFGLVESDDRPTHHITVIGVAAGADGADSAVGGKALGVANRQVLGGFNRSSQHCLVGWSVEGSSRASAGVLQLVALWQANYRVYGAPKLWKAAQRAGIDGALRRRRVRTTRPAIDGAARPADLVEQEFTEQHTNSNKPQKPRVRPTGVSSRPQQAN